jgi:predicted regulator of Ras-like GTPase activity (Roadblock/LC7/MglB family)
VLTTLVKPEAKMGVLFLEMRKAADDLTRLLDGDPST